jgi:hypothetical protein
MSLQVPLPLALRKHVPAIVEPDRLLGNPDQDWTWEPSGEFDKRDLGIYATSASPTSRLTGANQLDIGEHY